VIEREDELQRKDAFDVTGVAGCDSSETGFSRI
jgi:hypothetical protein